VRTGVTAIRPHPGNPYTAKVRAAAHVLNGFGKTTGLEQIRELGTLETPILLTNTLNVWKAADGLVEWMLSLNPYIGISTRGTVNPVVGECNDGYLNDIQGRHIGAAGVVEALDTASPHPVVEGNFGGGTGVMSYGFKAGIGSASRRLPEQAGGYTLGVLVQANFGRRHQLTILGKPVGLWLDDWLPPGPSSEPDAPERGSCMIVAATDAPLSSRQLGRLARRAPLGLARTGSVSGPGSGDYVIAFSTSEFLTGEAGPPVRKAAVLADEWVVFGHLIQAIVEATDEAVLNSLVAAQTMRGRDGHTAQALPVDWINSRLAQA
jgi:D-aminopeptidase